MNTLAHVIAWTATIAGACAVVKGYIGVARMYLDYYYVASQQAERPSPPAPGTSCHKIDCTDHAHWS